MPGVPLLTAQLGPNARLIVEAAWGADLTAPSSFWTWTDITADVRQANGQKVTITQGRGDETSQAQPASCTFQLDNTTGDYTPNNPASVRYPNVRRNTPIRVSVDLGTGGGLVTRFFGFANGFTPSWDISAKLAVVSVSASGTLRRLSQGRTPLHSPLYRAVTARTDVRAYWAMEDPSGATSLASGVSAGQAMSFSGLTLASDSTEPGSAPLPKFGTASSVSAQVSGSFTNGWQADWYYRIPADPTPNEPTIMNVYTSDAVSGGSTMRWRLTVGGPFATVVRLYGYNAAGTLVVDPGYLTFGPNFFGQWVHAGLMAHQNGSNVEWQCVLFPVGVGNGSFFTGTIAGTVGAPNFVNVPADASLNGFSMGHLAAYDAYNNGTTLGAERGFVAELATDRLTRLGTEAGVSLAITSGITGVTDDYETSSPRMFPIVSGTWVRDNTQAHSGGFSLKSAAIGNSAQTNAVINVPAGATSMSVWYKVSSESGFDFFRILRDGVQESQFSGEVGWTQRTISVVGVKQVTFRYVKDGTTVAGLDAAWIDDLTFYGPSGATMGQQSVDTFVNLLRECEAVDAGVLYDGFSNGLGYIVNSARYNQPAALTLDMAAGQVDDPFAPVDDDQRNRNLVIVNRKSGSSATYEDKPGPLGTKAIGTYDTSLTVNTQTEAVLLDRASWEVHKGTVEGFRYPNLNLDFVANPSLLPAWLATKLNNRIDVTNVSSKTTQHPPGTVSLLLEGYTESLSPYEWKVSPTNCSPYEPYRVFKLNDTALGRLDTAGSYLAAGVGAGATSLTVATNSGPLWTTTPADFPLDLNVGGWQVTATGIAIANPTLVGVGTASAGNATSVTPALPAGIQPGDLLLCFVGANSSSGSVNTPAGWTLFMTMDTKHRLFWKIATGSDTAPTVTFSGLVAGDTTLAQCAAFRNVAMALIAAGGGLGTSGQNIAYFGASVPDNCMVLYIGWKNSSWTSVATIAGATEIGEPSSALGSGLGLVWDYQIQNTATTIADGSFVVTGGVSAGTTSGVIAFPTTQTFTVNPVPGAIAANAVVKVWKPGVLAL